MVNPSSAHLLKKFFRIWLHKVFLSLTEADFSDSYNAPQQSRSMLVSSLLQSTCTLVRFAVSEEEVESVSDSESDTEFNIAE